MNINSSESTMHYSSTPEPWDFVRRFVTIVQAKEFLSDLAERRAEEWKRGSRETVLNTLAPILAKAGSAEFVERQADLEASGVLGIAEQLRGRYHLTATMPGAKVDEIERAVVYHHSKSRRGLKPVHLRDIASRPEGIISKETIALHPNSITKQVENGKVSPRDGVLLQLAHEIARLDVLASSQGVGGKNLAKYAERQINELSGVGRVLLDFDIPEKVLAGGLNEVRYYISRNKRLLALTGLVVGAFIVSNCGPGPVVSADSGENNNEKPTTNPTVEAISTPVITATPAEIVVPVVTVTEPVPPLTTIGQPLPHVDLQDIPGYIPPDSTTTELGDNWNDVQNLKSLGLVPIFGGGTVAFVAPDGKEYYPSFDKITGANGVELVRGKMDKNGVVEYVSADGKTKEYHLLAYDCPDGEICVQAYSTNVQDLGYLYLVRIDKETGSIKGYVNTGEAGADIRAGENISWSEGKSEYWSSVTTGASALERMNGVKAYSYEGGVLTIQAPDGSAQSVRDPYIYYYEGFGGVVETVNGYYFWDEVELKWVDLEQLDGSAGQYQLADGQVVFSLNNGEQLAIATEDTFLWGNLETKVGKLIFTSGEDSYEWDQNLGWVEAVSVGELDQQIFDSAPEIEGVEKVMHNLWGVVGVDENGEITKYLDYYEYNYDRSDWREVVREEDGHLVILNAKGEEQIVYPERITLNVNGKEITYNTTARGYKENVTPQTPEEYKAVIEALAQAITEGKVLMPFAEGALTLTDLEKLDKYNSNATAKDVFHIRSDKWQELTPDQIPYSPLAFPYDRDGLAVEGVVIVPVMLLDGDGKVTGFWAFQVVDNKWMKFEPTQEIQRLLDRDVINRGGTSMASPIVNKTIEACVKALDKPVLDEVCGALFSQTTAIEAAFATAIESGEMDEQLVSAKLLPTMTMVKVAKAAK